MTAARTKKIARLIHSLKNELDVLESAHKTQFETTATLKDKLTASKRARVALNKARRISDLINQSLNEHEK
jgi:hypothetical protein